VIPARKLTSFINHFLIANWSPDLVILDEAQRIKNYATKSAAYVKALQDEYRDDIDIFRLASELIVDAIVPPDELRAELVRRFAVYSGRRRADVTRHHPIAPV